MNIYWNKMDDADVINKMLTIISYKKMMYLIIGNHKEKLSTETPKMIHELNTYKNTHD
jgi:hypothetical protein